MNKQLVVSSHSVHSVLGLAEKKPPQLSRTSKREGLYLIGATGVGKSTGLDDVSNALSYVTTSW